MTSFFLPRTQKKERYGSRKDALLPICVTLASCKQDASLPWSDRGHAAGQDFGRHHGKARFRELRARAQLERELYRSKLSFGASNPRHGTSTTTTTPGSRLAPLFGPSSRGPPVLALQKRLVARRYWLGTPNGSFGDSTEQAVCALRKVVGLTRAADGADFQTIGTRADAEAAYQPLRSFVEQLLDGVNPRTLVGVEYILSRLFAHRYLSSDGPIGTSRSG